LTATDKARFEDLLKLTCYISSNFPGRSEDTLSSVDNAVNIMTELQQDNYRLLNVAEAQRRALLHWRKEFDKEFGRKAFNAVCADVAKPESKQLSFDF
jgi:hypothetical protein